MLAVEFLGNSFQDLSKNSYNQLEFYCSYL